MSGQWEVVGKKGKDRSNKNSVPVKKENFDKKKGKFAIDLNLEEVLPKSQVKNLYNSDKSKENKAQEKNNKAQENKKVQKKTDKPQEVPKPKFKTIQSALTSIDVDEFQRTYENCKCHFPDAPIVWLQELSKYLNQKVPVEVHDPVFSSKATGYPWTVVPGPLKAIIENSIADAGQGNAKIFFDIALTSMVTDMSKGSSALGYKFYLQYLAISDPSLVIPSMNKYIVLRNSYQNRPNIGLSILWCVGQAGMKNFNIGLKVFQDLMLPLIEMKNYSKYITTYLMDLIRTNKTTAVTKEEYLLILETVFSNKKNFPNDVKQDLIKVVPQLKTLLFIKSNKETYHHYVDMFLKKLSLYDSKSYQNCLCDVLVECFVRDSTCFSTWSSQYTKTLHSSAILIKYLDDNWASVSKKLNVKLLNELLNTFKITNEQLSTKRKKDEGLYPVVNAIGKMNEKMIKKKKSGFPYKSFSFFIMLGMAVLVYYDVKQHGSWKASRTNEVLKDTGIYEYTGKALNRTKEGLLWVDRRVEQSFPGAHKTICEFSTPYVELTKELGVIGYNMCINIKDAVVEKYPIIIRSIDSYAPGLIDSTQKAVSNVWSTTVFYVNKSAVYLKEKVFVGHLAPENMQRIVVEAFNTTRQKACECYLWLYEKVQTTIK